MDSSFQQKSSYTKVLYPQKNWNSEISLNQDEAQQIKQEEKKIKTSQKKWTKEKIGIALTLANAEISSKEFQLENLQNQHEDEIIS